MTAQDSATGGGARDNLIGALAMAGGNVLLIVNDTLVKLAASELPMSEVIGLRAVVACALLFCVARWQMGATVPWPRVSPRLLLRSLLEMGASFAYLYALRVTPIGTLAGLLQITPLAILAGGAVVFREQIGWRGWCAALAGLGGALLIVRPGAVTGGDPLGVALAALALLLSVSRDLMTRALPGGLVPAFVAGWAQLAMLAGALCLAPFDAWVAPPWALVGEVAAAAAGLALANTWLVIAMRRGRLSVVIPFRYAGLLAAVAAGLVVWGEFPDGLALVGSGVIIAAGLAGLGARGRG